MTTRTVLGLIGALVVLGALALLGQREPQTTDTGSGLLIPGLQEELGDVTRLSVVGAGGEPVVTLERGTAGWTLAERGGYPADLRKIRHTLLSLAEGRILEAKTANPDLHDRLGVEAIDNLEAGGVAITLGGIDTPVNLIVGDSAGDYQAYVRRADEAQSYLIDRDPEVGRTAADWLNTELLAIAGDRVQRVTVTHPDGEVLSVFKDTPEETNFAVEAMPPDRELQYASVANPMGTVLANLSLEDVEPMAAIDAPLTVTEFRMFDGLVVTAESIERNGEAWVALRAEFDAPDGAPSSDEIPPGEEEASPPEGGTDIEAEAQELDQRLNGWRYRIATYQFDQMTRRMDDLLRSEPDE